MLNRIFINTKKQISRSGWAGWGSIAIMTMAFLVASIFGGLAYISNLYIKFIEQKSNVLVFFEEGMDPEIINMLRDKWSENTNIKDISYTSEEEAYLLYSDYTSRVKPETYAVLRTREDQRLPSSLDIQLYSLEMLEETKAIVQADIEAELEKLEITSTDPTQTQTQYQYSEDPTQPPIKLVVDDENLDQLREVFFAMRIAGIGVITLLFIVIFFFTFMTVEFRLSRQMEEIGVMQLVGGSLTFIRSPYVLEGGFYGAVGALTSSLVLGSILVIIFVVNQQSDLALFVYENIGKLEWPDITVLGWSGIIGVITLIGFFLGATSSFMSIRRYIR